jgi:hypothetical protein
MFLALRSLMIRNDQEEYKVFGGALNKRNVDQS